MIIFKYLSGVLLFLSLSSLYATKPLYEWNFEEFNGTELSKAKNTGSVDGKWSDDFSESYSDGNGNYLIGRMPGETSNVFIEIDPITSSSVPGRVWLILEVAGWNFAGETANETLRIGFADKEHDRRPSVAAQIRFGRTDANKVSITGEGFGDKAKRTEEVTAFVANQSEPVTFVLEVDKQKERFELHYRLGDGPYIFLGEGKMDPERNANFLRFGLSGHFGAEGEFLKIDRIAVTELNPIP